MSKKICAQIHTNEPFSYESRVCFIASAVDLRLCVCVCFIKVWVKYQMLKLNGTEKFLVCTDHGDLVKIRSYKHRYIVSAVQKNVGILLGVSVETDLQIKSAKIEYAQVYIHFQAIRRNAGQRNNIKAVKRSKLLENMADFKYMGEKVITNKNARISFPWDVTPRKNM